MATSNKIRVGIVGVSPSRGFASIAHIPALQALPDFEISAVCTTRQDSAEAAARHFGIPMAFSDAEKLAQHPDVDLVTVSVKVPDHYPPVMAAIEAGKHVYCEWPLGRNTDEAARMLAAAERKGIRHAVGLQGQMSPAIKYTKDLIAKGYVGRVLTATMISCAPNWGSTIDRAYQADFANGAMPRRSRHDPADGHRCGRDQVGPCRRGACGGSGTPSRSGSSRAGAGIGRPRCLAYGSKRGRRPRTRSTAACGSAP